MNSFWPSCPCAIPKRKIDLDAVHTEPSDLEKSIVLKWARHDLPLRARRLWYNFCAMNLPVTIDLVRHGTTAYNEQDRMQGQVDIPLSDKGRREVAALAERLRDLPYDLVVHSPLQRAEETARIIVGDRVGLRWQVYPEFIEIDLGDWEGLIYTEMMRTQADFYHRWLFDENLPVPGGESFAMVAERARAGWQRLQLENARRILVCAHATSNRAILAAILELPLHLARRFRMDNAALSRFTLAERGGRVRPMLELWNRCEHLKGE